MKKERKKAKKTTLRFFKDSGYLDAIEETGVDLIDPHNREMGYAENFCLCLSLDLSNGYEPYLDCEILCIDDWGTSIFIFTESLEPELSIGDFRNMVVSNGDYYTKTMDNSISLSFNNNETARGMIKYLLDGGVKSKNINLILFVGNPIPHYVNLYSYLFNSLHCTDIKIYSDEVVIDETTKLVNILGVDKLYRTPENDYLICVDLNKNKDAFNKALLYLSAYVNKTYKTK